MVIYSALAFKSNVGIYHSEQIAGELTFNFSSLPQLPYLGFWIVIRVKVHFLCVRVGVWWVLIFIQFNSPPVFSALLRSCADSLPGDTESCKRSRVSQYLWSRFHFCASTKPICEYVLQKHSCGIWSFSLPPHCFYFWVFVTGTHTAPDKVWTFLINKCID